MTRTRMYRRWSSLCAALFLSTLLLAGCGSSQDDFVVIGGASVPPTAVDDNYNSIGNTLLRVTAADGVLVNDTVNGGGIIRFDAASTQGGTVALQADGAFDYTPPDNVSGVSDTFTYTLGTAAGESSATVTVDLNNFGRFVDNTAAPGGDGTAGAPFTTIQAGIDASASGDTVFVFARTNPYNENITLADGITVRGEGAGFIIDNGLAREIRGSVVLPPGDRPRLTGDVMLASNSALGGLQIEATSGQAVLGTNISSVHIFDNRIINAGAGLVLADVGGTNRAENNEFLEVTTFGIGLLNGTAVVSTLEARDNTFTAASGEFPDFAVVVFCDEESVTCVVDGNTVNGDANTGAYDSLCGFTSAGAGSDGSSLMLTNNAATVGGLAVGAGQEFGGNFDVRGNTVTGSAIAVFNGLDPGSSPFRLNFGGPAAGDANTFTETDALGGGLQVNVNEQQSDVSILNNRFDVPSSGVFALTLGTGTYEVSGNDLRSTAGTALMSVNFNAPSGAATLACRDNNVGTNGAIVLAAGGMIDLCAAISGNTGMDIAVAEAATAILQVEGLEAAQGGPLDTLNNGAAVTPAGTPISVDVGSCGI
jgi:hypothetical protein